jgi:hypothetical protein
MNGIFLLLEIFESFYFHANYKSYEVEFSWVLAELCTVVYKGTWDTDG